LHPYHKRHCPASACPEERGRFGEEAAASYLRSLGYKVLLQRFASSGGEIDLVCRHGTVLVFTEVKARSSDAFGRPAEAVTPAKQRKIAKAAQAYLRLLDQRDLVYRFDVVEVYLHEDKPVECSVIEHAFALPEPYMS